MKWLLTTPSLLDQGGVASYINALLPFLSKKHEITCFELGSTHNKKNILYPVTDQFRFRKLLKTEQFDALHVNPSLDLKSFIRDGFLVLQAKRSSLPVLVFWHGWGKAFEPVVEKYLLSFFRRTFARADGFIVLASAFEEKLRQWGINSPVFKITTTVHENLLAGVDLDDKLSRLGREVETNVLFLARLERAKGVFETLDGVRLLQKKGFPVTLSIAGDGSVRQELEEYIKKLNVQDNKIRFLGYVRNQKKIEAFLSHDIYCFPTFYGEGLPTSVLEAMAFGMPVITKPVGGLADIFEDGKMGVLMHGNSPEEIADCIEKIIGDKKNMLRMGRYNIKYARKNFMASVVAARLDKIYQAIL